MSREAFLLQGGNGGIVLTSANGAVTGRFRWVQVINEAVLEGITAPTLVGAAAELTDITLPAGLGFGGLITGLEVASGVVIAYYE
jgi:hypothetical protein